MSKDTILFVNIGSYCDGTLTQAVLEKLVDIYDVKFITDKSSIIKDAKIQPSSIYESPGFITSEPVIGGADTSTNLTSWLFTSLPQVYQLYQMIKVVQQLILDEIEKSNPKFILFHYSHFNLAISLENINIPFGFIYYSPAFFNNKIPWLFDSHLRQRKFQLYSYKKNTNIIKNSWETIISRTKYLSYLLGIDFDQKILKKKMKNIHLFLCWDKHMTEDIQFNIKNENVHYVGSVYPNFEIDTSPIIQKNNVSNDLKKWINENEKNNKPIVLVSFGSYSKFPQLKAAIKDILPVLFQNYAVILHKSWSPNDHAENEEFKNMFPEQNYFVQIGYIPYAKLISHLDLVVFTGSLCLQFVCLRAKVNMIFVPLITEQFFWAKNYEHFTKTPYIDISLVYENPISDQLEKSINHITTMFSKKSRNKISEYLDKVQKSMIKTYHNSKNNEKKNILSYIIEKNSNIMK